MRLNVGPVPPSRVFNPNDAGWNALREPEPDRAVVIASILSIPIVIPVIWCVPEIFDCWGGDMSISVAFAMLVGLALLILVHELIHGVCFPRGLSSPYLIFGVWPSRLVFYASYDAQLSRERFLFVLAAPFVALTLLLLPAAIWLPQPWRALAIFTLLLHTSCCTADLLGIFGVWRQVPKHAQVHNDGWKTYWSTDFEPVEV